MDENDDFEFDKVERWDPNTPVPDNKIPIKAAFDELICLRLVMAPLDQSLAPQTYVVFRNIDGGNSDHGGREIMRITGAKQVNLWYRVNDMGDGLKSGEDPDILRSLEEMLQIYDDERKARMQ